MRLKQKPATPVQLAADLVRAATADDDEAVLAVMYRIAGRDDAAAVMGATAEIAGNPDIAAG